MDTKHFCIDPVTMGEHIVMTDALILHRRTYYEIIESNKHDPQMVRHFTRQIELINATLKRLHDAVNKPIYCTLQHDPTPPGDNHHD